MGSGGAAACLQTERSHAGKRALWHSRWEPRHSCTQLTPCTCPTALPDLTVCLQSCLSFSQQLLGKVDSSCSARLGRWEKHRIIPSLRMSGGKAKQKREDKQLAQLAFALSFVKRLNYELFKMFNPSSAPVTALF